MSGPSFFLRIPGLQRRRLLHHPKGMKSISEGLYRSAVLRDLPWIARPQILCQP
jgi:hypothetical protein